MLRPGSSMSLVFGISLVLAPAMFAQSETHLLTFNVGRGDRAHRQDCKRS